MKANAVTQNAEAAAVALYSTILSAYRRPTDKVGMKSGAFSLACLAEMLDWMTDCSLPKGVETLPVLIGFSDSLHRVIEYMRYCDPRDHARFLVALAETFPRTTEKMKKQLSSKKK